MEGYFFLASSWIVLILIFFFLSERVPVILAVHLLLIIILSQYFIPVGAQQFNAAVGYILLTVCYYTGQLRLSAILKLIIVSFVLGLCKSGYYLYNMLEPMWFLWLPSWIDNLLLAYLAVMLIRNTAQRMITLIMGMVISDLFLYFSHVRSGLYYNLYSLDWLDEATLCCVILLSWKAVEAMSKALYEHTKHFHKKEV